MFFFLFQIRKEHKVKAINHGAKILDLRRPHSNQQWFWCPMRASGLHDLIYTCYASFHLSVGEMTITLDDVACLLHISIEGIMLSHPKKVSRVDGVELMVRHLGVTQSEAVKNYKGEFDAYISYKTLRKYYEDYLDVVTRLLDPQTPKDVQERERVRNACMKRTSCTWLDACCLVIKATNASS